MLPPICNESQKACSFSVKLVTFVADPSSYGTGGEASIAHVWYLELFKMCKFAERKLCSKVTVNRETMFYCASVAYS